MSLSSYKHIIDANVQKTNTIEQTVSSQAETISQIQQGEGLNIDSSSIQFNGEDLQTTLNNYDQRITDNKDAIENFTPSGLTANDLTYNGVNLKSVLDLEIAKITANEQNITDIQSGNNFTVDATNAIYDNTDPQNVVTVKDKLDTQDGLITDNQNEITDIKNDITDIKNDITDIQNDITNNGSGGSGGSGGSSADYKKILDIVTTDNDAYNKCCIIGDYVVIQDDSTLNPNYNGKNTFSTYRYKNGNLEKIHSNLESYYDVIQKIEKIDNYTYGISSSTSNVSNGAIQIYSLLPDTWGGVIFNSTGGPAGGSFAYKDRFTVSNNGKYILGTSGNSGAKKMRVIHNKQINGVSQWTVHKEFTNFNNEGFFSNVITNDGSTIIESMSGGLRVYTYDDSDANSNLHNYVFDLGLNSPITRSYYFPVDNNERYIKICENMNFPDVITIFAYQYSFQRGEKIQILSYNKNTTPGTVGSMWTHRQTINVHLNNNHKMIVDGIKLIIANEDNNTIETYTPDANNQYVLEKSIDTDTNIYPMEDYAIDNDKVLLTRRGHIEMWKSL